MDRVPLRFVEEVLLQLDTKDSLYPSFWGKVAERKRPRKHARILVYFEPNTEGRFSVRSTTSLRPVALEDLDQFVLVSIHIREGFGQRTEGQYPLTKSNLKLLQRHLRRGHPCDLSLFEDLERASLVEQLCLAPSRLTRIYLFKHQPLPTAILTRNIELGTLRSLNCPSGVIVTQEVVPAVLRFVASENFKSLLLPQMSGEASKESFVKGVIDAFLSRPRRQKFEFNVSERYKRVCAPLAGEGMRGKVYVNFNSAKNLLQIYLGRYIV
uniref:Uncharacterized protein n=1 Tax=Steinernema glaseri TaxID=37863 RepID=A0A1I8A4F8_9BILA